MRVSLLLIVLLLASCNTGEKQIAQKSTDVSALAHSSQDRFEIIYLEAGKPKSDTKVIQSEALAGREEQGQIIQAINAIIQALPEVQDVASVWLQIFKYVTFSLLLLAVIVLLFQTGAGAWLRGLIGMMKPKTPPPNA